MNVVMSYDSRAKFRPNLSVAQVQEIIRLCECVDVKTPETNSLLVTFLPLIHKIRSGVLQPAVVTQGRSKLTADISSISSSPGDMQDEFTQIVDAENAKREAMLMDDSADKAHYEAMKAGMLSMYEDADGNVLTLPASLALAYGVKHSLLNRYEMVLAREFGLIS